MNEKITPINRLVLLVVLITATAVNFAGQTSKSPRFEHFRITVSKARTKPPNLNSHKQAKLFRTNLRNAAKEGVNFAGHFILTRWGCGASCSVGAIIDARSGAVYFPEETDGFSGSLEFYPNSQLLVLDGEAGNDASNKPRQDGTYYLRWTGNRLKIIRFRARVWN